MAEGARLESVYTRKCIEGSNPSLTAILNEKAWTNVQAFLLHVTQSERGEKPRQGSTKWLAAQRHFGRPTGRPQGELANQARPHRHIK